jgi:hypothetical protein
MVTKMGSSSSLSPSLLSSTERTERTRHGSFDDNRQGVECSPDDKLLSLCDAYRFNSGGDIQKMNVASGTVAAAAGNKDDNTGDHVRDNITSQNTSHSSAHHETHTNHPSDGAEHCFVVKTSSVDKPNSHPSNAQKPDICSDGMGNPVSGRRSIDDATKEGIWCDQIQRQEEKGQKEVRTGQIQEAQTVQTAPNANSRESMGVSMPSGAFNHFWCADAVGHENVILTQSKLATSKISNDSHYSPSAYKGTFKRLGSTTYDAKIQHNQNEYYLGSYQLVSDAALAYDKAAALLSGPFCILNFNAPGDYLVARMNEMMQRGIAVEFTELCDSIDERIELYLQQIQNGMFDVFTCGLLYHPPTVLIFPTFPRQKLNTL